MGQLRQGQVVGQVNSVGHCRGVEPGEAPHGIPTGWGYGGGVALLRLVRDKHGSAHGDALVAGALVAGALVAGSW